MLTAGVYFQYEAEHRCRTEFDDKHTDYNATSSVIDLITPKSKIPGITYDGCNLVRYANNTALVTYHYNCFLVH